MNTIKIVIPEAVVPMVRMTQRSKFVDPAARAYLSNKETLRWYMRQAMEAGDYTMFDKTPVCVSIQLEVTQMHKADLDNICKTVLDSAQGIVFKNDNYVDSILAERKLAKSPKLTFEIWRME